MSDSLVLKIPELRRLYQALDWLQPPSSAPAQQQKVWSSLQGKLHRLGPRPVLNNPNISDNSKLCAALSQLHLRFKTVVCIQSCYWIHAVLESQDNQAEATMLRLFTADHIKNIPGSLLVDVLQEMVSDTITAKQLADHLKPVLTAVAGGSLDA
ncbi:TPA: hypothetical protein ACH3X1_005268 [Trebouxia sp. C0004]